MKQKYVQKNDNKANSLASPLPKENQQSQVQLNERVYSRFQNFLSNQKFKKLKNAMDNYIGRNSPTTYRSEYSFHQQWQTKKKNGIYNFSDFIHTHDLIVQIMGFFVLFGYCLLVWFISFRLIFQSQTENILLFTSFLFGLLATVFHFLLKIKLSLKMIHIQTNYLTYLKVYWSDLALITYILINLSVINEYEQNQNKFMIPVHIFFLALIYNRASQIYKSFKMKVITSIYKDFFNLFDLLATLLIVAHIFALILYLSSKVNYNNTNWMKVHDIDKQQGKVKYIYSFYFACTTMLTVGYGDLIPSNIIQILAVLSIQIIGIAIFAYVINEIGITLSSIRKQEENIQKDLSTLTKIAKYYGLDEELQTRARAYILDNKTSTDELLPEQEKHLLLKLNDQLRTQINQQNSLKIIKSSVFFICHWSKKMQFQIAKKLTKKLYAPNQKLLQNQGRQSIYVIKRGRVDIFTNRQSGLKRHFKKLLKTIESHDQQNVTHNIFGYTSVISNRPIKLKAITKDFTVVYFIEKNDFIESVMDQQLDFQYYHQIKAKIDMQRLPQACQAPSILNIRQHYRPNIFFVIKKYKKKVQTNKRVDYIRDQNRFKKRRQRLHIYDCIEQLEGDLDFISSKMLMSSSKQHNIIKTKTITETYPTYIREQNQMKKILPGIFDSRKQFLNYFKRFNFSQVILISERQNYNQITQKVKMLTQKSIRTIKTKKQITLKVLDQRAY